MTTTTIKESLSFQEGVSFRSSVQAALPWLLFGAALVAGAMLWRLTIIAHNMRFSGEFTEYLTLMGGQTKMLLIGCHVIPYALTLTGRMLAGSNQQSIAKVHSVFIGASLLSLACAATALAI